MQDVADKKKEINDDDLLALITDEVNQPATLWSLLDLQVSSGTANFSAVVICCSERTCSISCEQLCARVKACKRSFLLYQGAKSMSTALKMLQVVCGTMGLPTATVRLMGPDGAVQIGTGMGTGPVDAAYKAIDSIVKVQVSL